MRASHPSRQRGAIALVLAAACALGVAAALAGALSAPAARLSRDRVSDRALAQAREALVAYAAGRPIDAIVGPGYLPCPDLDDDGWAEATCGSQNGATGQAQRLGRLPWKTLGLPDLRDGAGERLWYAVSSKPKGLLNCAHNEACVDMGPAAALGTISVRDATGDFVHDGRIADLREASRAGAFAVVFAPGAPLARGGRAQDRGCAPGLCDAAGRCRTEPPSRAAKCDPANYLDHSSLEDNATFIDRNDAAGRAANGDGFRQGPVREGGALVVNDRLAAIGHADVMPAVMVRIAREAAQCVKSHARLHGTYLPPAPLCRQALADATQAWRPWPGARFGRIPESDYPDCRIGRGPGHHWWLAWRDHVFYAVAPGTLEAADAAGRTLGPREAAILVAGTPLPAQARGTHALHDASQWLEGDHARLPALDAGLAIDGCAPVPACPPGAACNRVVTAARRAGTNDVVVAW